MVSSVSEAISALKANFRDFAHYLIQSSENGVNYRIKVGYQEIGEEHLLCPINPKVVSIDIIPVPAGSGSTGKIIAGIALINISIALMASGVGSVVGISTLAITLMGASLLIGGISSLYNQKKDDKQSQSFNPTFTSKEGGTVPILYGVMMVGLYVVNANVVVGYE